MKTDIIRIGNSQGVRIPKPILEQVGLDGRVEMEVQDGKLIISPARQLRAGWSDSFREMAEAGADAPLLDEAEASDWDKEDRQW